MLQTGQRVGTSPGTAVAATLFYNRLSATRGDSPRATSHSLYGATALTCAALVIAGADRFLPRRAGTETRPPLPADSPKSPRSADPV